MAINPEVLRTAAYFPQFFVDDTDAYGSYPTYWLSENPGLRDQLRRYTRVNGWTSNDFANRDKVVSFLNGLQEGGINLSSIMGSRRAPLASGNWDLHDIYGRDNVRQYTNVLHNLYGAYDPNRKNEELNFGSTPLPRYDAFDEALADRLLYRQFSAVLPMDVPEVKELVKAHMQNGDSAQKTVDEVRKWMTQDGKITIEQFLKNSEPDAVARVTRTISSLPPLQFLNNEIFQRNAPNGGIVDEDMGEALQHVRNIGFGASFAKPLLNAAAGASHGLAGLPVKALAGMGNNLGLVSLGTKGIGTWWDIEDNPAALKRHIISEFAKGNDPAGNNLGGAGNIATNAIGTLAEAGPFGILTGNTNMRKAAIYAKYQSDPQFREEYDRLYDEVLQSDFGKQLKNTRINPETGKREVIADYYNDAGKGIGNFAKNSINTMVAPGAARMFMGKTLSNAVGLNRSFLSPAAAVKANAYLMALLAAGGVGHAAYEHARDGIKAVREGKYGTNNMIKDLEQSLGKGDLNKYITNSDGSINATRYLKAGLHQVVGDTGKVFSDTAGFAKSRYNMIADWLQTRKDKQEADRKYNEADTFYKKGLPIYRKYRDSGLSVEEAKRKTNEFLGFGKKSASDLLTIARKEASTPVPAKIDDHAARRTAAAEKLNNAHATPNQYANAEWNDESQELIDAYASGGSKAVSNAVKNRLFTPTTLFNGGKPYMAKLRAGYDDQKRVYNSSLSRFIPILNRFSITPAGRAYQNMEVLDKTMTQTANTMGKYIPWVQLLALLGAGGLAYGGYKAYNKFRPQQISSLSSMYGVR